MLFKGLEIAALAFLCLVSLDTATIVAGAPVNRNITARYFKAGFKNVAYYADWFVNFVATFTCNFKAKII
jgi:hypothetical protein